jgi:rod shape determining protein RodA
MATIAPPRPLRRRGLSARRAWLDATALRHVDLVLLGATVVVSLIGLLMIYSATRHRVPADPYYFVKRQSVALTLGFGLVAALLAIDYRKLRDSSVLAYGAVVLSLLAVLSPLGSNTRGAQAWFQLPGSFQLEPSELAKFGIIVALAGYAHQHRGEMDPWRLTVTIALAAVPIGLVMLQPDLGTAMVLGLMVIALLAVAGARPRHLVVLTLLGATFVFAIVSLGMLKQYQIDRLTGFIDPGAHKQETYNTKQSQTALGSGGVTGRGLYHGPQTQGQFVPEQHTDFIFTALGEELGFMGSALLLVLFGLIVWRTWRAAMLARDFFGTMVCVGVLALFTFQIFENMGMAMGIMPVAGVPLPFMSYGGSATVTELACVGLVANVGMRRFS